MEWEKIFENDVTDKELIYKYTNSLYNSISQKQMTQSKMVRDLNRHFSKEDIQVHKKMFNITSY